MSSQQSAVVSSYEAGRQKRTNDEERSDSARPRKRRHAVPRAAAGSLDLPSNTEPGKLIEFNEDPKDPHEVDVLAIHICQDVLDEEIIRQNSGQPAKSSGKEEKEKRLAEILDYFHQDGLYETLAQFVEDIKALNRGRKPRTASHAWMSDVELDSWMLCKLKEAGPAPLAMEQAAMVGLSLKKIWGGDPIMSIDPATGYLHYQQRARSSFPRWALKTPSKETADFLRDERLSQNFYLVLTLLFMDDRALGATLTTRVRDGDTISFRDFIEGKPLIKDLPSAAGGIYVLVPPSQDKGYCGKAINFESRMKSHNTKPVNRKVRRAIVDTDSQMSSWRKYAVLAFLDYKASKIPAAILSIAESAYIALGHFTSGANLNYNYFDFSTREALASTIDIFTGWLEVLHQSQTRDADGFLPYFPERQDADEIWLDRFGPAFGHTISGASIADIVYGRRKRNLTRLLPNPVKEAYRVPPELIFGAETCHPLAVARKPVPSTADGRSESLHPHRPILFSTANTAYKKLTSLNDIQIAANAPTPLQLRTLAIQPPVRQPTDMAAQANARIVQQRNGDRIAAIRAKSDSKRKMV